MRTLLLVIFVVFFVGCAGVAPQPQPEKPVESTEDFDRLWDYDHPEDTERVFTEFLSRFPAETKPLRRAELLTQIARTHSLRSQFDKAHTRLDEAKALIGDAPSVALIRLQLERGRCFNSAGDKTRARPLFLAAFRLALGLKEEFYAIDAAHMLAIVAEPNTALEWNRLALDMVERSSSAKARKWKGSLTNNLGWTYFDRGEYSEALAMFRDALEFRQNAGVPKEIRIATWCVARTLRAMGQAEEALDMQQALEREMNAAGEKDGFVYEELAELYAAKGQTELASRSAAEAYELLSAMEWFSRSEPARLERLQQLVGKAKN